MRINFFLLLAFVFSFTTHTVMGQQRNFSLTPNVGLGTPVLDNGRSWHFALNPAWQLSRQFSVEGQLSYVHTAITGSFLSGNEGSSRTINILLGGRLFLNKEERKVRPYLNLMLGAFNNVEDIDGRIQTISDTGLGASTGFYLKLHRLVFGLSYDTPSYMLLRVGYSL